MPALAKTRRVYCRTCRCRHRIVWTGREMTKCNGGWWFVDRHPRTGNPVPISGYTARKPTPKRSKT